MERGDREREGEVGRDGGRRDGEREGGKEGERYNSRVPVEGNHQCV